MYYDDENGVVHFVAGVALGALVGAGIALLLAPQPGRKTRRRIVRSAEDLGDAAGDRLHTAARDVRKVADEARRAAERSSRRLRDRVTGD